MIALDYVKAFGVALLLMVLNVAASFGVVAVYAYLIEPGHDAAYYEAAAQSIAPWSSVFVGALLFFLAAWFFGVRKPTRSALAFAVTFAAIYTMIDFAIIAAVGGLQHLGLVIWISVSAKFAACAAGALLSKRRG